MSYPPNPYGNPAVPYGQPGHPGQFGPPPGSQSGAGYPFFAPPPGYPQQPPPQGPPPGGFGPPAGYGPPHRPQQPIHGPGPHDNQPPRPVPPSPAPEPERREPAFVTHDLPVATVDFIAGSEITETLGEVMGVVTRPRDMRNSPDQASVILEARQDAVTRMVDLAVKAGADAVIGLRFDGGKISDGASEVTTYGTAVKLAGTTTERIDDQPLRGDEHAPDHPDRD